MLFKHLTSTCLLSGALLVSLNVHAGPTDPVAVVNGKSITQQDYDDYIKARAKQARSHERVEKQTLVEEMIWRELLKQDALKKGLDKAPEFLKKINYLRDSLLMAISMHDYLEKHPIDDATLLSEYDRQMAHINVPKDYKVRHILLKTEQEAKAIIVSLDEGKAFGELAKQKSIDIGSAKKNGKLGWVGKQKVVPSFGRAVEKLEKGQYTATPVKSKYGWHVIQVDDIRSALPPFESVKDRIKATLQNQLMQQYMSDLKTQANIQIFN